MACRFLESLSLASLIAPIPVQDFESHYWEQQPMMVHRHDANYYGDLFTLQDFDAAVARSPSYVKLANAATQRNVTVRPSAAEGLEFILGDMRAGGTLVLDQLHERDPNLALLCRVLAAELGHRFQTNVYLTPPQGKGFSPHWDNHDVFILQVMGSKRWQVEKERRAFPGNDDKIADDERDLRGELHNFVLEQGDLAYIPRGFVHAAECGEDASLHITFGVTGVFWGDILHAAVRSAILHNEELRHALPLGFDRSPRDGLVKQVRAAFRALSDETVLAAVIDQYIDELVRTHPLDVSNQVTDFFQPKGPVVLEEIIGPRRAIVFQIHLGDDFVRLNFGARTITFPLFFHDALTFALNTPAFAIRDIPGELEDEERIAFAERLLDEGLVIRKERGQLSTIGQSHRQPFAA